MRARDYFPLGTASGAAFCNRTQESKLLLDNIKNCKHTLLMAPRRYGKSSLALRAISLSTLPFVEIDFYMARSEKVIEQYILNGVIELIGKALGPIDKLLVTMKKYVKNLQPKLNITTNNISLELVAASQSDPATNVKEALLLLEHLLTSKKRHAVLFCDEFQNVGVIAKGMGIEAAIRHAAQKMKNLVIIFSGSNRKLLQTMFEDDTRPLYKLCWKLIIDRIAEEHYIKQINKAAQIAWHKPLPDEVIKKIMLVTERHPYYVNKLCDRIWVYYEQPPTKQNIIDAWQKILIEEKRDAIKEIAILAIGQKNVLLYIAKNNAQKLTSKEAVLEMQMTSSSIIAALERLEEKDIIWKKNNCYHITNPVVKFYAVKYD